MNNNEELIAIYRTLSALESVLMRRIMKHGLSAEEAFIYAINTIEYSADDEQLLQAAKSLQYLLWEGYTFGIKKEANHSDK